VEYQKLARIADHARRLEAWAAGYEAAFSDVFDVYYRSYSDPRRRIGAVANVARLSPLMRERKARAEALARQAEQEFTAQGLLLDELDVVFLVGNHTANGWVAEFYGRPALFVALELLGAPPYDGILVSHEALHVAHMHHGAETWPEDIGASLAPDCQARALPTRSGYWLADIVAQHWLSEHSLRDVLRWDYAEATQRASNDLRTRKMCD
jgi:hypothetical protein